MANETMTLYKLIILYMLKQVNFPLTNAQLADFFISHEYTNYFTLQQAISEIVESGLISSETIHNTSRYAITEEGENTLSFFSKKIPSAIVEDIDDFFKKNRFKMRNEVASSSEFFKSTNMDYIVHCDVREGRTVLISFDISVPDEEQAKYMSERWTSCNSDIYAYVMKKLMSDSNE